MKRLIPLVLCLLLFGCSIQKPLDSDAIIHEMLEKITFINPLVELPAGTYDHLYFLPKGVTARVFQSSGTNAEEMGVFVARDDAALEAMRGAIKIHLKDRKESFEGYLPDELTKIENAIVFEQGKTLILCVTDDPDARAVIEELCS